MLRSLFALTAGAVLLVLGVLFSVVLLVVIAAVGLGVWAYLWWKTRKLRHATQNMTPDGQIFEGEAVVVEEQHVVVVKNVLPRGPRSGE